MTLALQPALANGCSRSVQVHSWPGRGEVWREGRARLARSMAFWSTPAVALPHIISTLLYCFNERDDVLLMQRLQEPNLGLWSPCGGKLKTADGESPYACAGREAAEELGEALAPADLHLAGLVSEHGYAGQAHWLMFLFEVKRRLSTLPPPNREGRFRFFTRAELGALPMPQTDREQLWPLFWRHRGGFFAAHCHCHADGRNVWTLEETASGSPIADSR